MSRRAGQPRCIPRYRLTGAVERGQTADALGQQILAGALEVWTVRSISGAGTIDQLRIDGAERLIGVSQLLHDARTEVLHHHIGAFHQLINDLSGFLGFQVDGQGALVAVA
jgi:hypothetical protein